MTDYNLKELKVIIINRKGKKIHWKMFVAQDTDVTVEQPLGKSKAHTLILESSLLDVKPDEIVFFPRFM